LLFVTRETWRFSWLRTRLSCRAVSHHYALFYDLFIGTEVKVACVIGGMPVQDIMGTIKCGCDLVVGTVGRLDDFIFDQVWDLVRNLVISFIGHLERQEFDVHFG
jgi:superfamily II DNA/RNA helicase